MARIDSRDPQNIGDPDDAAAWAAFRIDPAAGMAALYDRHAGFVYGLARRILNDRHEAEDVTQEVFVSLMTQAAYDPARGSLSAYLCAMARSRSIDRLRKRSRRAQLVAVEAPPENAPPAGEELQQQQSARVVREALQALPDTQRQVVELAYYQGLSQTEIATRLQAPLGTVKSWARAGLTSLRAALTALGGPMGGP